MINIARQQAVAGLIIDALIKKDVRMDQKVLFEAIACLEQIKQENRLMNQEVATFARMMEDAEVDYMVVKGQTLAALYAEPLARMPGDIDFLVNDYQQASKVLKAQWGVELPGRIAEKEVSFAHGTALYELHTYLIDFGSNRHRRYWENALAKSKPSYIIIDGEEVRTMEPTLYAAYVFLHLFFHFVHEGIGLRHLCDWAVMMHHYADEIDSQRLSEVLKNVGMLKAFRAFGTILVDQLGMADFPLPLSAKDRKLQSKILKDIMRGGNFGRDKRCVRHVGWRYKAETMLLTLSNSTGYVTLAPLEMALMLYRRVVVNMKLITFQKK